MAEVKNLLKKENSKKYFAQANKVLVAGVNSPVRSFQGVGGDPLVIKYADRQKLYDYDNNMFVDYCLSWGALILGHANRNVILASKKIVEKGTSFGTTTKEEVEIAEHIVECVPSIERIRFVNSGTEATMSAIRLARGFTKRDMIIKFDGCYHGHFDDLLTKAGSGVSQLKESSSAGIPAAHVGNTLSLPYNDANIFKKTVEQHKNEIACVIVEPVAGNMGVIAADKVFLETLRIMTKTYGIVLIFDEIMTGFRTNKGCVQADYGIIPDMTCLGKIIGGGFPVGAYGGRKNIMDCLAPQGSVYQAGTFSGNPTVMKAGLATLKLLNADFYRSLNAKCEDFSGEMNTFLAKSNIAAHLSCYKSMMSLRFRKEKVKDYQDATNACGGENYGRLFWHFLESGIYWPPADLEAFFVSGAHTKKDLDALLDAVKSFFLN